MGRIARTESGLAEWYVDRPKYRPTSQSTESGGLPSYSEVGGLPSYSMRFSDLWRSMRRQPASFWFVSIYLLFEYVRPQSVYESLEGPPYALAAIILGLVSLLFERKKIHLGAPEALLGFFTFVVVASSLTAVSPALSYAQLYVYLSWVLIYVLIVNSVNTEARFLLFMTAFLLYSLKMSQHGTRTWITNGFSFSDWGSTGAPGWFQNSGEFGIQMCVFLPLVIAFVSGLGSSLSRWKRLVGWLVAGSALTAIISSSSRGALIGAGALGAWAIIRSGKFSRLFRNLFLVAIAAATVYSLLPPEQKSRIDAMGDDHTSVSRRVYWDHGLEILKENPVLGIGYANWPSYHEARYGLYALPHNIFIEAAAELGYSGLLGFLALIGCTLWVNRTTRKLARERPDGGKFIASMANGLDAAMVGYLVSGFFVTVLYYPFFWINFAMTVALSGVAKSAVKSAPIPTSKLRGGGPIPAGSTL